MQFLAGQKGVVRTDQRTARLDHAKSALAILKNPPALQLGSKEENHSSPDIWIYLPNGLPFSCRAREAGDGRLQRLVRFQEIIVIFNTIRPNQDV